MEGMSVVTVYNQLDLFTPTVTLEDAYRQAEEAAERASQRRAAARKGYCEALMVRGKALFDRYRPLNTPAAQGVALDALIRDCVQEFDLMALQQADEAARAEVARLHDLMFNRCGPYDSHPS
jgi:hypothetical protein